MHIYVLKLQHFNEAKNKKHCSKTKYQKKINENILSNGNMNARNGFGGGKGRRKEW